VNKPRVSIIIPTYCRERPLRETLKAVLSQRAHFEVIVVDQTPVHEPGTEHFLSEVAGEIRHILLTYPNLPAARNAGVREARGEIVLFLDDDIHPGPALAKRHLRHYSDPTVGGVAGRVHVSPTPDPEGYPWPDGHDIFDRNRPGEYPFVRGCNMSFRRDLVLEAGLFDEHYLGNGVGEEEDLAFAIRRLGYRITFDPEAWVIHLQDPIGGCRAGEKDIRETPTFYRNKVYFALKNVKGLDFWRVLWDTYWSGAWQGQSRLKRQFSFLKGLWHGWQAYQHAGWHLQRLPYRWRGKNR